ncbi:MAG TPA: 50S ribosomal protein L29 [Terriglobales bacterium]|jgi:large subunit ribosomal protein L29|nr:50S ribosomal protein L29 [Terriglobales bacterium]
MAKGLTADNVRNMTEDEIQHQVRDLSDQLFRLKFQMKMGQTESLKKIRGLRRDIARVKTIARERELGNGAAPVVTEKKAEKKAVAAKAESKPAKKAAEKKTATGRK